MPTDRPIVAAATAAPATQNAATTTSARRYASTNSALDGVGRRADEPGKQGGRQQAGRAGDGVVDGRADADVALVGWRPAPPPSSGGTMSAKPTPSTIAAGRMSVDVVGAGVDRGQQREAQSQRARRRRPPAIADRTRPTRRPTSGDPRIITTLAGTSAAPATAGLNPTTVWNATAVKKNPPLIAKYTSAVARWRRRTAASANRRIGTIGSSRRRSTGTNAPIAARARTPDTITTGSLQPPRRPSVRATTEPPIATTPMTPPSRVERRTDSGDVGWRVGSRVGRRSSPRRSTAGAPSANTHRQPSESTRTPPRNGPPAVVIAEPLAHKPDRPGHARARRSWHRRARG